MSTATTIDDQHYTAALASVRHAIDQFTGSSDDEKAALKQELLDLESMHHKLIAGRVEIVLFGEIDTGKSALINALTGSNIAQVDVRGGWTKEVWHVAWDGCGYVVPGLEQSQVVLLDTPGINEVGGEDRAAMAHDAAARADLILFVTDSDLNQLEFSALSELAASNKPIILVFNKIDNYTPAQRTRVREVLEHERLPGILSSEDIVLTAADPLPREYVIESADGQTRTEMRQPPAEVTALKARILEILDSEGKALIALNAAMYAADKSDRIATMRVRMRDERATTVIWSCAATKAVTVAINPVVATDVLVGSTVDITMVVTLARVYGFQLTWANARKLIESIIKAAGWMMLIEGATSIAASIFKGLTLGAGTVLTALPQGAAAGYGSYIVGQAAKFYFEHGASWGGEAPKSVVSRILESTDKQTVIARLQEEIKKNIRINRHSK